MDTSASQGTPSDPDGVPTAPASRRLEVGSALGALVFLGALAFLARRIELRAETGGIDPRWWPELLGTIGLVLGVALLIVSVSRPVPRDDLEASTRSGLVRVAVIVAITAVYLVMWPVVGFLVATPVFLVAVTAVTGGRGWRALLLFPVLTTGFIYLLFQMLLEVPL
jgi:hypothetical protein